MSVLALHVDENKFMAGSAGVVSRNCTSSVGHLIENFRASDEESRVDVNLNYASESRIVGFNSCVVNVNYLKGETFVT